MMKLELLFKSDLIQAGQVQIAMALVGSLAGGLDMSSELKHGR